MDGQKHGEDLSFEPIGDHAVFGQDPGSGGREEASAGGSEVRTPPLDWLDSQIMSVGLRDYFAARIAAALVSRTTNGGTPELAHAVSRKLDPAGLAKQAYDVADALLDERRSRIEAEPLTEPDREELEQRFDRRTFSTIRFPPTTTRTRTSIRAGRTWRSILPGIASHAGRNRRRPRRARASRARNRGRRSRVSKALRGEASRQSCLSSSTRRRNQPAPPETHP